MEDTQLYCTYLIDVCKTKLEWKFYFDCTVAFIALTAGPVGLYKIFIEIKRIAEQRVGEQEAKEAAAKLKKIEFFLAQHRRLFDDTELAAVLACLDGDLEELAAEAFWEKKRKFLTFIEEIALLVNSSQIPCNIAYYMFGYYSICAAEGRNFKEGISMAEEDWMMFFDFSRKAAVYRKDAPDLTKLSF